MYVVKTWYASNQVNEHKEYVHISGRQEGIIAWILSLVGIDPTVHLRVTAKSVTLEARTFWGFLKRTIPVSRISEVQAGFARPWLGPTICAMFGMFFFFGIFATLVIGELVGAFFSLFLSCFMFGLAWAIYELKRSLVLGVIGFGGSIAAVLFRPSFIEGKRIEGEAAEHVAKIIQALVDAKSS